MKFRKYFWTVNRIGIVLIGYIGLGLFALIYLFFTSNEDIKIVSSEEIQEITKDEMQFYNFFMSEKEDKFNDNYLVDEWSMEFTSDEVTLAKEVEDTYGNVFVLIDWRDDASSNEIYAKTYQTPYIFRGINLTSELTKNQFEFTGDKLLVKNPPVQQFTYNSINPKIEILENLQAMYSNNSVVDNSVTGTTFLYLNVPNHVTIIDEGELRFYP